MSLKIKLTLIYLIFFIIRKLQSRFMQIFRFSEKTAEQSEGMQTERSKILPFAVNDMLNLSAGGL